MRKKVLNVVIALSLLTLFGCNNRHDIQAIASEYTISLKPMQQSYHGIFPCADCEGIDTSLFLEPSGTWIMNQYYQGKNTTVASYGEWARTADKLILTSSQGNKQYFLPRNNRLVMLSPNGEPIQSSLNFTLKAANLTLPTTPMLMKGEYTYLADAAIFKDCESGKIYPVESNIALQEAYLAVRDENNLPVLLQFDAHFTQQPKPDSDTLYNVLVSDGNAQFFPDKSCQSQLELVLN